MVRKFLKTYYRARIRPRTRPLSRKIGKRLSAGWNRVELGDLDPLLSKDRKITRAYRIGAQYLLQRRRAARAAYAVGLTAIAATFLTAAFNAMGWVSFPEFVGGFFSLTAGEIISRSTDGRLENLRGRNYLARMAVLRRSASKLMAKRTATEKLGLPAPGKPNFDEVEKQWRDSGNPLTLQ